MGRTDIISSDLCLTLSILTAVKDLLNNVKKNADLVKRYIPNEKLNIGVIKIIWPAC